MIDNSRKEVSEENKAYLEYYEKLQDDEQEFASFLFGENEFSFESIKQYVIYYRAWKKGAYTLDPQSARQFLTEFRGNVARAFLKKYCELRDVDPIIKGKSGKKERKPGTFITEEDYAKIRPLLYEKHIKFGIIGDMQFYAGCRRSEVLKLRTEQIQIENWEEGKPLKIQVTAKKVTKTILIPANTAENLMTYIAQLAEDKIIYLDENPLIIQNVSRTRWSKVLGDTSKRMLGKRITTHTLRRSRATIWHDQGIPLEEIQKRLGHKNLQTTMIYIEQNEKKTIDRWEKELMGNG